MSKKIFVTTDLSNNSKAGIRFAIQLAKQAGSALIFFNAVEIDKPTRWSDTKFDEYVDSEISDTKSKLDVFVKGVYKESRIRPGKYRLVVERVSSVQDAIVKSAIANKADFICISTRGAGKIKRLIGTNTSAVISTSPVPVLAIPSSYRATPISHVLYASDLNALPAELNKVKRFAGSVKSKITVLHYDYLYQLEEVRTKFNKVAERQKSSDVKFYLEQFNIENSLSTHLKNAVKKFNPSIVVLFTKQNRDWFERLFLSSKSAEVSFDSKKPLLIYGKQS
jgi:nucleotide-binding universal stress UspA family protein